jgi:beta-lactam-binding protein with PASTA domain
MGFNLSSIEDYVANHLRMFILLVAALVLFTGLIAVSVFFIAVSGAEQTMVPNVAGKDLTEALIELQRKELYPRLSLRYTQSSRDKGLILEQDPLPGTIVRAGRRVRLVVSQGVVLNKVENFIGRNIDEIRMDLQVIHTEAGGVPLLKIKEPVMYEFSSENPGTILVQKPEPGTDISGPTELEFVVSQGRENATITVPQLTGLDIAKALELISSSGINFHFSARPANYDEKGETVVMQVPAADTSVTVNTVVQLTVANPEKINDGEIFGIFRYHIPPNPYPLSVRLDMVYGNDRHRLFSANYMGGDFTVPYRLPAGSMLVLTMSNRELHRELVGGGHR